MPYGSSRRTDFLQILQRDLVAPRPCARPDVVAGLGAASAASRRSSRGRRRVIDHHASPNAIDGSLDVIAGALDELGLRSVLCYETSDRDGPAGAPARPRRERDGSSRASDRASLPLTRGLVGAHAAFTLSDETLARLRRDRGDFGVGLHVHAAEDAIDDRARWNALAAAHGASTSEPCSRTASTSTSTRRRSSPTERVARAQRALEHEQLGRPRAGRRAMTARLPLGTDGIGVRHVRGVARGVLPAARGRPRRSGRLAARAPRRRRAARGLDLRRAAPRHTRARRARRPRRPRLRRPHPARRRERRRPLDLRRSARASCAT